MTPIDLGSELSETCCPAKLAEDTKKYYPSFHYSGDKPLKLPSEGEMMVRFKKVSSEHRVDSDNKDHYSCTVEVREIVSVEGEEMDMDTPASHRGKDTEEALEELHRAMMKSKKTKSEKDEY